MPDLQCLSVANVWAYGMSDRKQVLTILCKQTKMINKLLKCSTTTSKKMLKYNKNNYKSTQKDYNYSQIDVYFAWPTSFISVCNIIWKMKLTDISLDRERWSSFRSDYRRWWNLSVKRNIRQLDYNYSLFADLQLFLFYFNILFDVVVLHFIYIIL